MAIVDVPLSRMMYEGNEIKEILAQVQALEAMGHTVHLHLSGPYHMSLLLKGRLSSQKQNAFRRNASIVSLALLASMLASAFIVIGIMGL